MSLAALLLRPDNFTPPTRTPWGGRRIAGRYKAKLTLAGDPTGVVGESWELSAGPEFPSFLSSGRPLAELLAEDARAMLGDEAATGTGLLVKWVDTDDALSVQIHPGDDYTGLADDETGKPEAWYVIEREPGAGLYLGFGAGTDADAVRAAIEAGEDLAARMRFVPVEPGDVFAIEPGMPHAIGRGVTLIEPQRVRAGRRGVTYRYWDWNRRYDALGHPDPNGARRPLQLDHALAVTDWARACDADGLRATHVQAGAASRSAAGRCEALLGPEPDCAVRSDQLRMARLAGSGPLELPAWNVLRALTVIEGSVVVGRGRGAVRVGAGRTAALPAGLGAAPVTLEQAHALVCACVAGA